MIPKSFSVNRGETYLPGLTCVPKVTQKTAGGTIESSRGQELTEHREKQGYLISGLISLNSGVPEIGGASGLLLNEVLHDIQVRLVRGTVEP